MPPKQQGRAIGGVGRPVQQKGYAKYLVSEITNPENRSVVTSVAFFAAGVAFLSSSWSEILLPPL